MVLSSKAREFRPTPFKSPKEKATVMLRVNQSTTDQDLALALENEHGTFLAQKGGQSFLVVAEEGHSIASLRAVGRPVVEVTPPGAGEQPWVITKISNSTEILSEASGYGRERRSRERVEQRA
jgi:hypothetical protein